MDWQKSSILKFIRAYKQSRLWNTQDRNYKNLKVRRAAWLELANQFGRSVQELKVKIKHLRCAYVTEKKRTDCSEDHHSRLYYYKEFKFLDHLIVLRKPNRYEALSAKRACLDSDEESISERGTPVTEYETPTAELETSVAEFETPIKERQSISSTGSNTRYSIVKPEYVAATTNIANGRTANDVADDSGTLSAAWGALYRKLTPEQQLYANKTIMGVLYQGALGNLDQFSYKVMDNEHSSNDHFQI